MKKTLFILAAALVSGLAFAKPKTVEVTAFDNPQAVTINANDVSKKIKDNIRFINQSSDSDVTFTVYYFNTKTASWDVFGTAFLKGKDDTSFVDSKKSVKKNKDLSITADNGKKYNYEFKESHSDLYITVKD